MEKHYHKRHIKHRKIMASPASGELDLENFTEAYLSDRAQMLSWRLKYDNSAQEYNTGWNSFSIESDVNFIDHTIKVSDGINSNPITFRIDNLDITTTHDRHIIFGSDSDESFTGGSFDDHIYGIADENTLQGRTGNDTLEGGLISFLNQQNNSSNPTWRN